MAKNNLDAKHLAVLFGAVIVVGLLAGIIGSSLGNVLTGNVIKDAGPKPYGYEVSIIGTDRNGPRIEFGTNQTPGQFMRIGAWSGVNNIDLKNRTLRVSGGDVTIIGNLNVSGSVIENNPIPDKSLGCKFVYSYNGQSDTTCNSICNSQNNTCYGRFMAGATSIGRCDYASWYGAYCLCCSNV